MGQLILHSVIRSGYRLEIEYIEAGRTYENTLWIAYYRQLQVLSRDGQRWFLRSA